MLNLALISARRPYQNLDAHSGFIDYCWDK